MGINFSHCHASWAYSGFMRFRIKLARSIGWNSYAEAYEKYLERGRDERLEYDSYEHPLVPLLEHSDCDGYLMLKECAAMAQPLRDAVEKWDDPFEQYDKENAIELATGMEKAATVNERLRFE